MDLPSWSPFPELVQQAKLTPHRIILRDNETGVEVSLERLLNSVVTFRNKIRRYLDSEALLKLTTGQDVFICVLVPAGWEFAVSTLAILALGAAVVPLASTIPPKEARYLVSTTKAAAMIYQPSLAGKVIKMKTQLSKAHGDIPKNFAFIDSAALEYFSASAAEKYVFTEMLQPNLNRAGSLLFTSGTAGAPMGVVYSYNSIIQYGNMQAISSTRNGNGLVLNRHPAYSAAGFWILISSIFAGACIEYCMTVYSPRWFWQRIKQGDVTSFNLHSSQHQELAQYFEQRIDTLPPEQKAEYVKAISNVQELKFIGSPLTPHIQQFWTELREGKSLSNNYTCAELLLVREQPQNSFEWNHESPGGPLTAGSQIKLHEGEVLARPP